jgi:glycosyltransferase involved in cell wall biosynthesis
LDAAPLPLSNTGNSGMHPENGLTFPTTQPVLTIAIPTFNRNKQLNVMLEVLLPQLTPECRLLVVDNASTIPVETSSKDILAKYVDRDVQLIRNRFNIGGNANIMRCFEYSETEYLWLLGDDDKLFPSSISSILKSIKEHPQAVFINFKSDLVQDRNSGWTTKGTLEFLATVDSFANLLFMSAGVYALHRVQTFIRFGYHYAYSCAPHLAMLLSALGPKDECYFNEVQIVLNTPPEGSDSWPVLQQALGVMTLLELNLTWQEKKILGKVIANGRIPYKNILPQLASAATKSNEKAVSLHLFRQIRWRSWEFDSYFERLFFWFYNILLIWPDLVLWLRNLLLRARSKSTVTSLQPQSTERL